MKTFNVTEEHIKLLQHSYVSWNDMEFGAASIDPKYPYGDRLVYYSMGKILGYEIEEDTEDIELEKKLSKLHEEIKTCLEIVLNNLSIKVGLYTQEDNKWTLLSMAEEEYLQVVKDFCIARDIAYIKEDLHNSELKFLYELLNGDYFIAYSNLDNRDLIQVAKELYLTYIKDPFMLNIKSVLKELDTTLYTEVYIDKFIKLFSHREKIDDED